MVIPDSSADSIGASASFQPGKVQERSPGMTVAGGQETVRKRMVLTLKDRYFWVLVTLVVTFILYTFPHDFANISWFPPYGAFSLTYTTVDHILFLIIVVFSAYRYGVIVGIATCLAVWLIHAVHDIEISVLQDTWLALVFILALGIASAWIVGSYVHTKKEQERAEKQIIEAENRYNSLIHLGTEVGEAVVMLQDIDGKEGIHTFVSAQWPRITGYASEELLGMCFFDLLNDRDRAASLDRHRRKMAGEAVPGLFDMSIIRKDGTEVPIELTGGATIYNGKPVNALYIRDITERKHAQKQLEGLLETATRTAKEWQETFDSVADIVALISPDFELLRINRAGHETSGKKQEELIGKKCYEVVHGLSAPIDGCPCMRTLETAKACSTEVTDQGRSYIATASPLFGENGQIIGFTHTIKDITEYRRIEQELRNQKKHLEQQVSQRTSLLTQELERVKWMGGRLKELYEMESRLRRELEAQANQRAYFMRAVVHELKTPLTAVLASSEALKDAVDESKTRLARNVHKGACALNKRIDELLDLAKGEIGMLKLVSANIDPIELVREVAELVSPDFQKKYQSLLLDIPPSLPELFGDEGRLKQVIFNLLDNALKFNRKAGQIVLRVRAKDCRLVFEVQDEGPGVSPEEQKTLFQPYHRLEADPYQLGGLGLGLALSKILVELQGGQIFVRSEKGQGSTFGFSIPIKATENSRSDYPDG